MAIVLLTSYVLTFLVLWIDKLTGVEISKYTVAIAIGVFCGFQYAKRIFLRQINRTIKDCLEKDYVIPIANADADNED